MKRKDVGRVKKKERKALNNPKLSVVIPTYNEESDIRDCIDSLLNQSYKNFEVIIVDDGSKDGTKKIVRNLMEKSDKIKLIEGEHKGPGFSRNLGAEKSKGEILVFVDADMVFDKDYLRELTRPIREGKTIGTEERYQKAMNLENIWSRCWGQYVTGDRKKTITEGLVFRAILRDVFFEKGGFDPSYGYADDQTFYFKYGMRSLIADDAICCHKNPETLKQVYKQSGWIGASMQNKMISLPVVNYIFPFLLIVISPVAIPLLALRKCYKNKDFSVFLPWMVVFMFARYFGTINGLFRKIYLGKNAR